MFDVLLTCNAQGSVVNWSFATSVSTSGGEWPGEGAFHNEIS